MERAVVHSGRGWGSVLRCGHALRLFLLITIALPHSARADRLERLWEIDLKKSLQGEFAGSVQSFNVKKLVLAGCRRGRVVLQGSVVLIGARDGKNIPGHYEIDTNEDIGWSPDSRIFHSGPHVIRLEDHKSCDLPRHALFPQFLENDSVVAMDPPPMPAVREHTVLTFPGYQTMELFDSRCRELKIWEVGRDQAITDASAARQLLSIQLSLVFGRSIVDPSSRKVLHDGVGGWFSDNGRAVCRGNVCWDVDTGKGIALADESGRASSRASVSAGSSRVVLDDTHESPIPFSSTFTELSARRRVWDFRANKEVVSSGPQTDPLCCFARRTICG